MTSGDRPAAASGVVNLGDIRVHRLGYGAMRLTGEGIWGYPSNIDNAKRVLRRAVDLGINFIDTADSYGPHVSEELIYEALSPYDGITIATKGGLLRTGPAEWIPLGKPEYLRQQVELSLRRLGVERIDLYQLHRVDPQVPIEESLAELVRLQQEGKIREIGLSGVNLSQLEHARIIVDIASVQNLYNLTNREADEVIDYCERNSIVFIPWSPIASGELARRDRLLADIATEYGPTPGQLALAWLLRRSPVMLPIPGTTTVEHLEENVAAASVELSLEQYNRLSTWSKPS